ncbi:MAG: EamA family transporter [Ferruginibacter sp.]
MPITGSFIALLASICWAICAFPFTKAGRHMSVASMNLVRLVGGTLLVMLVAIIADHKNFIAIFSSQYIQAWIWLAASGIVAIGIGDYLSYSMYAILSHAMEVHSQPSLLRLHFYSGSFFWMNT